MLLIKGVFGEQRAYSLYGLLVNTPLIRRYGHANGVLQKHIFSGVFSIRCVIQHTMMCNLTHQGVLPNTYVIAMNS